MHFELNHKIYKIDTVLFFVLCPYFFIYGKFMCKAKHGYIEKKKSINILNVLLCQQ